LIATRKLDNEFYANWQKRYQSAALMVKGKDEAIAALAEEVEKDFELLGSTAIEDKLQDEVGSTIRDIKSAGIQIWVLTGDKIETAINIGMSCELLND
jgi:P-type E1-E2 ATPase